MLINYFFVLCLTNHFENNKSIFAVYSLDIVYSMGIHHIIANLSIPGTLGPNKTVLIIEESLFQSVHNSRFDCCFDLCPHIYSLQQIMTLVCHQFGKQKIFSSLLILYNFVGGVSGNSAIPSTCIYVFLRCLHMYFKLHYE